MSATELGQALASTPQIFRFFKTCWTTFQERRKQAKARAALYDLNDRELSDIGIARGEIEYVALNRSIDPRGACSPSSIKI